METNNNTILENNIENNFQPQPVPKVRREYSAVESVYAWLCFLAGYLFCRVGTAAAHPLGGMLFITGLFIGTAVVLKLKHAGFGAPSIIIAVSAVLAAVSMILSANGFLQFIAWSYCIAAYCLFVYTATGNSIRGGLSNYVAADLIRAMLVLPFACIGYIFGAAFTGKKGKGANAAGKIIVGLVLAVVPTTVVLALLSYDADFNNLIDKIFNFDFFGVLSHIGSVILGIPVAMYFFGMFMSGIENRCSNLVTAEGCDNAAKKARFVPAATVLPAVLPILALYVIFFISQWKYYVSGFVGVLPDDTSYANYAREGFFQLCAVAVINFIIVALIALLMRRREDKPSILLKVISIIFSVFTLVLISTAIAKMVMYINCYGLTHKRVYASWFMVLLAILFVLIIAKQFAAKLKLILVSAIVCVVMFTGLAVSGVDSLIAGYNVNRYLDGTSNTVDVEAMLDLGDSAVPHMARLAKEMDKKNNTNIAEFDFDGCDREALYTKVAAYLNYVDVRRDDDLFTLTVPRMMAHAALDELGVDSESHEGVSFRNIIYGDNDRMYY